MLTRRWNPSLHWLSVSGMALALAAWPLESRAQTNQPPTAVIIVPAGGTTVGGAMPLLGSSSTDPDGDPLTYTWSVVTAPPGSAATVQRPTSALASFTPDRAGLYVVQLVVGDAALTDTTTAAFATTNTRPVADAGAPQSTTVSAVVTLDGSGSTDPDGDSLAYQWTILQRPPASTAGLSDPTAVAPTFAVDAPGDYLFELVVADAATSSLPATVAVSTGNSAPTANAGPDQSVASGALVTLSGHASTDPNGDPLTYAWTLVQTPFGSLAAIAGANSIAPTFIADRRGTFVAHLTVTDPVGARSSDDVAVSTSNSAPVARAGADLGVDVGIPTPLNGSGSTDVDGDPLSYVWSVLSQPPGSIATLSASNIASPTFSVDRLGDYVLQLMVSDGLGGTSSDTVLVVTANARPLANAGPDQSTVAGRTVTLDGSGSSDPDLAPLTYTWALVSVPSGSAAALSDPTAVQPTFVADLLGTYVVQLTVNDGKWTSRADTVTVTTGNTAPVADAGADPARRPLGGQVQLDGIGSTDADGHPLSYSWALISAPPGSAASLTNPATRTPTFTPDLGGDYVVQLIVNDGFADSQPDTVLVRVNTPPVANAGADFVGAAGASAVLTGAGTDADTDALTFAWTLTVPPGSASTLTGASTATPSFVPDVAGDYTARLIVNDGFNDSAPDDVVVTVTIADTLALTPTSANMLTSDVSTLTVTASQPSGPGGLVVTLTSSDASVASAPATVTILQGQTDATFDVTSANLAGSPTITASAPGHAPGIATVAVALRGLGVSLASPTVTVSQVVAGTVTLTQPAPAGGVTVSLATSDVNVVTVLSPTVAITAGATSAPFSAYGMGIGVANVLATAPGFTTASAPLTSTLTLTLGPAPFDVERASTRVATLSMNGPAPAGGLTVTLSSDDPSRATVATSVLVPAGDSIVDVDVTGVAEGGTTVRATAAGVQGANLTVTVIPPSAAAIDSSPADGEGSVAVTRETILRFSRAIANPQLITAQTLFAQFGGAVLPTRIHVAPDRKAVTLFYLQTLPASARVRVQFQTNGLIDDLGVPLDGDLDDQPGGLKLVDFDTLTLTTLPGTAVTGRVFASRLGDNGVNTPLAGVVISVDGLETTLRTTTDAMGNFTLNPAPVGEFFVHIDGRAATNGVPVGAYYPVVGKKWESKAQQSVTIPDVFLPLVEPGTLRPVSQTQDTVVTFPPSVIAQDPRLAGVTLTVPADSLYADSGARGGMVGIGPVAADRLPSPLPPGLNFPLVITVQTDGATNFDRPVPVCFPNLPDPTTGQTLAGGAKSALWSFNHDIGNWEIVGPMTVSANATTSCSDPSVGIRQPGWHGSTPGSAVGGGGPIPPFVGGSIPPPPSPFPPLFQDPCHAEKSDYLFALAKLVLNLGKSTALNALGLTASERIIEKLLSAVLDCRGGQCQPEQLAQSQHEYLEYLSGAQLGLAAEAQGREWGDLIEFYQDLQELAAARRAVEACQQANPQAFADPFGLQADVTAALTGAQVATTGHSVAPTTAADALRFKAVVEAMSAAVSVNSPGSRSIDASEQASILALPRPNGLSDTQIENWIRRQNSSRFGVPPLSDFDPGLVTLNRAASDMHDALSRAHSRRWSSIVDGLRIGLAEASTAVAQGSAGTDVVPTRGFALVENLDSGTSLRMRTSPTGLVPDIAVASESMLRVRILEPTTSLVSDVFALSGPTGHRTTVARGVLRRTQTGSQTLTDSDADGLPDEAEFIVGTRSDSIDTDGDGISDYAEIQQGTTPLDGLTVQTGILATADTPGTAVDVAARNDVAVVADSGSGISVLNVAAGLNPVIVAQVDTPGTAQAVAFENTLVAVADGPAGLAIVDISDPPTAIVVRQLGSSVLGGGANAVAVAGGTAYVGLDVNKVVAVDLATGAVLETVTLPGAVGVQDVAIERDTLYVLTVGQLHAIPLQAPLQVSGVVGSPGSTGAGNRRLRLFVGGGIAYATHTAGYNTFSLAVPGQPALLDAGSTSQFGWKQIVANGSGLGLAAVSPNSTNDGPHHVSLYDVSDPTQTDQFITEFVTPGIAAAVSIYNGIGYVADSQSGLQVLNYLAFDGNGVAPTVTLDSNFAIVAGVAEEGKVMRLTALVDDDVQVRSVEFFVNGIRVARDGNFPFEYRFITPLIGVAPSFTVRACAFDTGGSQTCTTVVTVTLVQDASPPTVRVVTPTNGSLQRNVVATLTATFSESMDSTSVSASTFLLFSAGPDGQTNTADDVPVTTGVVSYNAQSATGIMSFVTPLPIDKYRAVVGTGVTDLAGLPLSADVNWAFEVRGDRTWISDTSGSWHTASNWSGNQVPQPGDFVVIDRPGSAVIVTYSQGALSINTLRSTEDLVVSGTADLSIEQTGDLASLTFTGGTFRGAGSVTTGTFEWSSVSTLATLAGTGSLTVTGASTIASPWLLRERTLRLGTSTAQSGTLHMFNGARIVNPVAGVWTATAGSSTQWLASGATASEIANEGRLRVQAGSLTILPTFLNSGIVELQTGLMNLDNGGRSSGEVLGAIGTTFMPSDTFSFEPTSRIVTAGTVRVAYGTVTVGGEFTAEQVVVDGGTLTFGPHTGAIGTLTHTGGTINGSADVLASTLVWNGGSFQGTGDVRISGNSTISGGQIVGRTLRLGPTTTWSGSSLQLGSGSTISNPAGGVVDVSFNGVIFPASPVRARLENLGTIRRLGAGNSDLTQVFFDNIGTVELQAGVLTLGFGSASGTLTGASGTTLRWGAGTFDLAPSSSTASAGDITFLYGSSLVVRGAFDAVRVTVASNAQPKFLGTGPVIGALTVEDAWSFMQIATTSPASVGTMTLSGVGSASTMTVTSALNVGTLQWTGGGFTGVGGTVTVAGATTIAQAAPLALTGTRLELGPTSTWSGGGTLTFGPGATIEIGAGETLSVDGAASISCPSGCVGASLQNLGTLRKSGSGLFTMGARLDNSGLVDLQQGSLHLLGGGTHTGSGTTAAGTLLRTAGVTFAAASSVVASDTVEVSTGTVVGGQFSAPTIVGIGSATFNSTPTVSTLTILSGSSTVLLNALSGLSLPLLDMQTGRLTSVGPISATNFNWAGGAITGPSLSISGTTNLLPTAGPVAKSLAGTTLTLGASSVVSAGVVVGSSGTVSIVNGGTGTMQFNGNATLCSGSGTCTFSNAGTLQFGSTTATVTVGATSAIGNFVNTGTVRLRLEGSTLFDRVVVRNAATLGGTLDVSTINGFVPSSGDVFSVLTYGSRAGTFATINGNGETYTPTYGATALTLTKPVPAPGAIRRTTPGRAPRKD
jgi:hypothetical protein